MVHGVQMAKVRTLTRLVQDLQARKVPKAKVTRGPVAFLAENQPLVIAQQNCSVSYRERGEGVAFQREKERER